jgi:molybdopterin synthase sulfur carrier subunit
MRDASPSTTVTVRLVYLARLREAFATAAETLDVPVDDVPTVDSVIAMLRSRGGRWAAELAPGRAVRFAVNQRLADRAHRVGDGDEVAIFPPVTGG